jgi:putative peptidoglycan lipid II flippase
VDPVHDQIPKAGRTRVNDSPATQQSKEREDSSKPSKGLAKSTLLMALGTLLSRITGFARTLALIMAFGVTDRLPDVYNVANNAPNVVYELILGGILAGTLVPVFVRRFTSDDEKAGWDAVSAILTVTGIVLVGLTALVALAAPWIIDVYTANDKSSDAESAREVATFLLRLFAPQVALYGFISIATALLQAKRRFAVPMFAPILNNLVVIAVLLSMPLIADEMTLASVRDDTTALVFLGLGTTAGVLAMTLCLIPSLYRICKGHIRWNWNPRHEAIKTVLVLSGWTVGFVIANQVAFWVTTVLAYRSKGDYTVFMQAYNFFILPHAIFTVSIISALQPDLAEKWSRLDVDAYRSRAIHGLRIVSAVLIPAAIGYAVLAHPILDLLPTSGELDDSGADRIAAVVAWMAVGLPGFSAFLYIVRAFQAMQIAKTVFYLYLFENGINIVTAYPMHAAWGVEGLAASHSLAYTLAAVVGLVVLRSHMQGMEGSALAQSIGRIVLACVPMTGVVLAIRMFTDQTPVLTVTAGILSGAVVYLAASKFLGIKEIDGFLRPRRTTH